MSRRRLHSKSTFRKMRARGRGGARLRPTTSFASVKKRILFCLACTLRPRSRKSNPFTSFHALAKMRRKTKGISLSQPHLLPHVILLFSLLGGARRRCVSIYRDLRTCRFFVIRSEKSSRFGGSRRSRLSLSLGFFCIIISRSYYFSRYLIALAFIMRPFLLLERRDTQLSQLG